MNYIDHIVQVIQKREAHCSGRNELRSIQFKFKLTGTVRERILVWRMSMGKGIKTGALNGMKRVGNAPMRVKEMTV